MASDYLSTNITIIGGDYRHFLLYKHFASQGFSVSGVALQNNLPGTKNTNDDIHVENLYPDTALLPSEVWITGIPFTKDHLHIYSENPNYYISLEYFFHHLKQHPPKMLIGGQFPKEVIEFCREEQIPCHDLLKCNSIATRNAIPTAEGAIYYAMEASSSVLHNSNCLVLGFGKCGKILATKLNGLSCNVTVSARKEESLAEAEAYGYDTLPLEQLTEKLGAFSFIFNTIPICILDKKKLSFLSKDTVIIDIASMPGGVDFEGAKQLGITTRHCLGIPGKMAPKTAAEILAKQIVTLLKSI